MFYMWILTLQVRRPFKLSTPLKQVRLKLEWCVSDRSQYEVFASGFAWNVQSIASLKRDGKSSTNLNPSLNRILHSWSQVLPNRGWKMLCQWVIQQFDSNKLKESLALTQDPLVKWEGSTQGTRTRHRIGSIIWWIRFAHWQLEWLESVDSMPVRARMFDWHPLDFWKHYEIKVRRLDIWLCCPMARPTVCAKVDDICSNMGSSPLLIEILSACALTMWLRVLEEKLCDYTSAEQEPCDLSSAWLGFLSVPDVDGQ